MKIPHTFQSLLFLALGVNIIDGFAIHHPVSSSRGGMAIAITTSLKNHHDDTINEDDTMATPASTTHLNFHTRRSTLSSALLVLTTAVNIRDTTTASAAPAATKPTFDTVYAQIKEAKEQLTPIPQLIKSEKWDAVRAILITPPLSDCWSKTPKLLKNYAAVIGDEVPDGDELAALELKEEALDHLRFLDMAAYNNVFNPIKAEGENGATKELIKSYYEDPVREYEACARIFDDLVQLGK